VSVAEVLVRAAGLAATAALLAAAVRAALRALPAEPRRRRDRRAPPRAEPRALARIERRVDAARATAFDVHFRLRPLARQLAAALLARRAGLDLDGSPEPVRELLGEEAWELVRADREPPADRYSPGMSTEELRHLVEALEGLR
jgi:hypothetical protein